MGVPDSLRTSLADRYRLERELGQGGMATVYLAEDLKHRRKVAIKVLRPELAAVIGAERFLREIQTIATLQHPHILGLIDSGEVNGTAYYVMPFVDGESLRDRLRREQQLPVSDAVRLATEVAAALDYAHRHGVIHRDIKPENILLHDGQVLVADFGIALAVSSAGGGSRMTETGMSLGTPHYMSPEQAMGERVITGRSDVYALGAVTYEMLVGEPPFTGPTAQAIVAKVMTADPAGLSAQRRSVPPAVEDAVLMALSKLPADRFATAAEFAAALKGNATVAVPARRPAAAGARSRRWLVPLLGAVAALATAAAVVLGLRLARRPAAPVDRFSLDIPDLRVNFTGFYGISLAIARDGSRMAFVTRAGQTVTRLAVRDRGDLEARLLPGTEGGDAPFFSPDGRWLGFFAGAKLYKVAVAGGTPVMVADQAQLALPSAVWLPDGRIVYAGTDFKMMAVDADGGNPVVLVPAPKTGGLRYPVTLLENGALVVTRCGNTCAGPSLVAIDVKTQAEDTILVGATQAALLPDGTLIAVRTDGTVVAAPFDARRHRLTRPPTTVLSGVQVEIGVIPEFAVADDGTLVYLPSNAFAGVSTVAEVDRAGHARVLDPGWKGRFISANLSPDGQRIAVSTLEGAGSTAVGQAARCRPAHPAHLHHRRHQLPRRLVPRRPQPELQLRREGRHPPVPHPGGRQRQARAPLARRLRPDRRGELVERRSVAGLPHRDGAGPPRRLSPPGRGRRPADPGRRRPGGRIHAGHVSRRPLGGVRVDRIGAGGGVRAAGPRRGPGPLAGFVGRRHQPRLGLVESRALLRRPGRHHGGGHRGRHDRVPGHRTRAAVRDRVVHVHALASGLRRSSRRPVVRHAAAHRRIGGSRSAPAGGSAQLVHRRAGPARQVGMTAPRTAASVVYSRVPSLRRFRTESAPLVA